MIFLFAPIARRFAKRTRSLYVLPQIKPATRRRLDLVEDELPDERELSLAVVGIGYANADGSSRIYEIALCRPGDPIELRPEPDNEHDEHAVAVFRAGGGQMGYLNAERAPWIGGKLKAGEECIAIFQGEGPAAAYIRVRFGGEAPTLPPERPAAGPEPDFYPDPDPPDWGA